MTVPHDRVWYSIQETAYLRGCSRDLIELWVRRGQRKSPTGQYIPKHLIEHNGRNTVIHRSFIFTNEPGPTVALMVHPHSQINVAEEVEHAISRWLEELNAYQAWRKGRAA
jgi:hypothetical protein